MSDKYILRAGAIDAIKRNSGTLYTREAEFLLRKVILLLKNAPAADVAEVVRCKDCIFRIEGRCFFRRSLVEPDNFCSWGEYQTNTGGNGNVSG